MFGIGAPELIILLIVFVSKFRLGNCVKNM
jgi:hypothetical protein